jgi:pimeloyl-ACP methyl ester carboxylesterase
MNLHYQKIGNGTKILLAFHGMGQDFSCFLQFAETFENQYTTYLFDLPFHGKNEGSENRMITKEVWTIFMTDFLQKSQIEAFSIIAFSMGGRFALATVEAFAERIQQLFLLAPDGVSEDPVYTLATRFGFSRKIFYSVLKHNHKLYAPAEMLVKVGLVHKSVLKFAKMMVDTPQKQKQLYQAWVGFYQLRFDIKKIADVINQQQIDVQIFMGKYDKVMPIHKVLPLSKHIKPSQFVILEATHGRLVDKTLGYLKTNDI